MAKGELLRERSEIPYRKIDKLNQSMVGLYAEDPMEFYKIAVLGQPKEENDTSATKIGSLVDSLLLEYHGNEEEFNQHFDEQFCLFNGTRTSKQAFTLAEELFKVAKRNIVDGVVDGDITTMFQEAFLNTQALSTRSKRFYSGKNWKQALNDFDKNGREYYDALLSGINKKTVDLYMINICKRITSQIINDENVGPIFRKNDEVEELNKYPIEFPWRGFECKMEADKIHIRHNEKLIQPYDLKTTWMEFIDSYRKNLYYIQNGWYYSGIRYWADREGLSDYEVRPLKFIVGDTSPNQRRPLIYETTEQHIEEALVGFTFYGKKYRGILDLLDDIKWANDTGIWNISRENYENHSTIKMNPFDDNSRQNRARVLQN